MARKLQNPRQIRGAAIVRRAALRYYNSKKAERITDMTRFTEIDGRDIGDIKIYALSTCGWCKKTKKFFEDNHIKYAYVDVDWLSPEETDPVRKEQLKYNPAGSFPTIVVDGACIVGYDEEKLNRLLGR
jgi:glutaredoxin-like protein NrdH